MLQVQFLALLTYLLILLVLLYPAAIVLPTMPGSNHPMLTRSKTGTTAQKHYSLAPRVFTSTHVLASSPEPKNVKAALSDPLWLKAMKDEYAALLNNKTWTLVPFQLNMNVVGNKWVYRVKYNPDGSILKYKARLVAKGFHQTPDLDFFDTYSPVIKASTIRVVFTLAVSNGWDIQQVDINNAFLNGELKELVFMQQPEGFIDQSHPSYVCKLEKALYGLK
ncbi:hypothetical protein EZV62_023144 [Acer yangbiense]|uniref:Reverse transcriptase Ty1/copia-type domain-containing protein n=1 Tax=Acer yangbiense TaxID=1000413 RepID=A0A5C7H0V6_9ROSI|nr:hypothetical protein EZV62_023144 [Acer yangbiense]